MFSLFHFRIALIAAAPLPSSFWNRWAYIRNVMSGFAWPRRLLIVTCQRRIDELAGVGVPQAETSPLACRSARRNRSMLR